MGVGDSLPLFLRVKHGLGKSRPLNPPLQPSMLFANPDYPHVVLSFTYRGFYLELDQSTEDGLPLYAVWATHATGCAVAVPGVVSRTEAIYKAKRWVDRRLSPPPGAGSRP